MMKKILAMLLTVALLLTLAACAKPKAPADASTAETAPAQTETQEAQPQPEAQPGEPTLLSITLEDHTEEQKDDAGTTLAVVKWQTASVVENAPQVQKALDEFNKTIDTEIHAMLKELAECKAADRQAGSSINEAYESDETITVLRADTTAVSLLREGYYYSGGAHGSPYMTTLNIDGTTGQPLELADVFTGDLNAVVMEKLTGTEGLYDDWQTLAQSYLDGKSESGLNWTLDREGLTVIFPTYEIAPYAAGPVSVTLAYADYPESFSDALTAWVLCEEAPAEPVNPDAPKQETNELPIC